MKNKKPEWLVSIARESSARHFFAYYLIRYYKNCYGIIEVDALENPPDKARQIYMVKDLDTKEKLNNALSQLYAIKYDLNQRSREDYAEEISKLEVR